MCSPLPGKRSRKINYRRYRITEVVKISSCKQRENYRKHKDKNQRVVFLLSVFAEVNNKQKKIFFLMFV